MWFSAAASGSCGRRFGVSTSRMNTHYSIMCGSLPESTHAGLSLGRARLSQLRCLLRFFALELRHDISATAVASVLPHLDARVFRPAWANRFRVAELWQRFRGDAPFDASSNQS